MQATRLWALWQAILLSLALGFTRRGKQRFVQWATGLALNVEEHTITQSLVGLDRVGDWKALEAFAGYGSWDLRFSQQGLAHRLDRLPDRTWHGYRVWAGDDTKVHRGSPDVWGTCTFHDYSARSPNRATTVRAYDWVVVGALLPTSNQPALFLPHRRPAVLPQDADARPPEGAAHRFPHQVRVARRTGPAARRRL